MSVPVVGLTLRPIAANGRPPYLMRNRAYYEALEGGGAAVMSLPISARTDRLRALYDRCDAICVPGGPDVQPRLYGEETRGDCRVDADAELDDVETVLISWAIEDDKPLLAICRGAQILNVALGGTLWQDLLVQFDGALRHDHAEFIETSCTKWPSSRALGSATSRGRMSSRSTAGTIRRFATRRLRSQ